MIQTRVTVLRDGHEAELPQEALVPGDVIVLAAGAAVPADCRILRSTDLFVDESTLTGESYPAEKDAGDLARDTPLAKRTNALFQGSHVVSGTGRAVVVQTGANTVFGEIAERLRLRPPETEFEGGLRRFGELLIQITMLLVIAIFGIDVYCSGRQWIRSSSRWRSRSASLRSCFPPSSASRWPGARSRWRHPGSSCAASTRSRTSAA